MSRAILRVQRLTQRKGRAIDPAFCVSCNTNIGKVIARLKTSFQNRQDLQDFSGFYALCRILRNPVNPVYFSAEAMFPF
jgi:hypothetical protein